MWKSCRKRWQKVGRYSNGWVCRGILGKPPEFQREKSNIQAVPRVSDQQCMIKTPKYRRFLDTIMVFSRKSLHGDSFDVLLKKRDWIAREEHTITFFWEDLSSLEILRSISQFVRSSFEIVSPEVVQVGNTSDLERENDEKPTQHTPAGKVKLRYLIQNVDVRRTVAEFARCFCSGSIS